MAGLMIPFGERASRLIHVSEAERGLACGCVCPVCKDPLIARKGKSRAQHFAHQSGTGCNRETLLHFLGKHVLHDRLSQSLKDGRSVAIEWKCEICYGIHLGDLLRVARAVELERMLGACRPDILLADRSGKPIVFVEIVVSHPPEDHVRQYAAERSIRIVEFKITSTKDLEALASDETLRPSSVNACTRPKCPKCSGPTDDKVLRVIDASCWKCQAPMKIALIDVGSSLLGPRDFTAEQVLMARSRGAILRQNYSHTMRERYLSNTCMCGAMSGDFYLHDFIDIYKADTEGVVVGQYCGACEESEQST